MALNTTLDAIMAHPNTLYVEKHEWPRTLKSWSLQGAFGGGNGGTRANRELEKFAAMAHYGKGEIVTVGDTGLDYGHCLFSQASPTLHTYSTLTRSILPPLSSSNSDSSVIAYIKVKIGMFTETDFEDVVGGHGTHVCGIIIGNGDSCPVGSDAHGMGGNTKNTKLLFIDFGKGYESRALFVPPRLRPLLNEAYEMGSRIFSASWGTSTSTYTFTAEEMDRFAYENDDFVFVIANGNSGDYNTIESVGSPATAKNVISVGALVNGLESWLFDADESSLASLGLDLDEVRRNAPMYTSNTLVDFSSRGPTSDGRMKPNVCAAGAFVHSAMAGTKDKTLFMAGTSQATPTLAALIALLRSWLIHTQHMIRPSSALVRGIFYQTAEPILGGVAGLLWRNLIRTSESVSPVSEMSQGFGRADLEAILNGKVRYKDREYVPSLGIPKTYSFEATEPTMVRVTLSWTDYPGYYGQPAGRRVLVNDLDMRILVWRKLQSLSEKPELVILAGAGSVHELDRVNNQERAKFYVEPGDVVRVVVSGSGAFAFDRDQMFALVWSSTLVEQHHSEDIQCTEWDPERECISRVSGKMGVMRCIPEEMEWGECLEVKQRGCEPGEAWYGHLQRCGCYQHIPCSVGGFEMCTTQGDKLNRTCARMEQSVFSTVTDRVHSESSASTSIGGDRNNLVAIW